MKVAIDIDGCISEYPILFSVLTKALIRCDIEIFIISSRENSKHSIKETEQELEELGIFYNHLILTDDKQKVVQERNINLFIDNQIENFRGLSPDICCMLVRENMNYCYETDRFLGSKRTTILINE